MRFMIILALVITVELFAAPKPQLSTVEQVRNHWAFKPILMPSIPSVKSSWIGNEVDKFVWKQLQDKGWKPSGRTDRRTLIRRATMDLTGLMPSFAEVRSFEADDSPDAWAKLLDRLLASPHYGERWGRHWLDVARYADNKGYVGVGVDRLYPYSYTYRDYVVRAFNEDLPYDQFIIEQIAADALNLGDDKRALAAMGFLTLGRRFLNRQDDIIDDRIDVVTRGLMGFTVTCARCHDHKYDPIPTADYYSLHGVFASSDEPKDMPLLGKDSLPLEHGDYLKEKAKREKAIQHLIQTTYQKGLAKLRSRSGEYMLAVHQVDAQKLTGDKLDKWLTQRKLNVVAFENWRKALAKWKAEKHPVFLAWHRQDGEGNPLITRKENMKSQAEVYGELFQKVDQKWVEQQKSNPPNLTLSGGHLETIRQVLYSKDTPATVSEKLKEENRSSLLFGVRNQLKAMRSKLSKLAATHPGAPPRAHVLKDKENPIEPYIYIRGGRGNRGPRVARQFLEHLSKNRKPFVKGSGRLELAKAIANLDNPLTARVLVNRVWAQHFGQGLVGTLSDFGLRALPPSHPQLLDYLACRFVKEGWSIKKLHRWIMSSSTYQQSSNGRVEYLEIDPANRLLWKMNRQRLSFEGLRDAVLQASGQLDLTLGGRPVRIEVHPTSNRRTIYGFIDRQNLPSVFRVFDFANPDTHCPERYENIVPQQALYLMNSPFILDQSERLSQIAAKHAPFGQARVKVLYHRMFQRDPKAIEIVDALRFVNAAPKEGQSKVFNQLAQILFLSNEFRFLD